MLSSFDQPPLSRKLYKVLHWRLLYPVFIRLPTRFIPSAYGVWLTKRPNDRTHKLCVMGAYGMYLSECLRRGSASVFFDIGANQGLYTLVAAKNPNISNIYSFEPNPELQQVLEKNISRNKADCAVVMPVGLGTTSENLTLYIPLKHSGGGSLHPGQENIKTVTVRVESSDFLDEKINLPQDARIFVKIDTEGYEPMVLTALKASKHWSAIQDLFIEMDESKFDVPKMVSELEADGFTVVFKNTSNNVKHYDLHFQRNIRRQ